MMQSELVPGQTYFVVYYADAQMRTPVIQTLVYRRAGKHKSGRVFHQFEELKVEEGRPAEVQLDEADASDMVLDGEGLLETLRQCLERSQPPTEPEL